MQVENNPLHLFQKNLNCDKDTQETYIEGGDDDSSCSSSCSKLSLSKVKKSSKNFSKKNKNNKDLLTELINQHDMLFVYQKKMYKLKNELKGVEISSRYTVLELNNTQFKLEETLVELKSVRETSNKYLYEVLAHRIIIIAYLLFKVYLFL